MTLLVFNCILAQNVPSGSSRKEAYDAFDSGDYLKAYGEFNNLLETYPKDPLYKYYSGACLVRLKKEPGKAAALLQDALSSSREIRRVPGDVWFYLGRSQQMSGQFQAAIRSFDRFTSEEGRKASRQYSVQGYIDECEQGKGRIDEKEASLADIIYRKNQVEGKMNNGIPDKQNHGIAAITSTDSANRKEPVPEEFDKKLSEALRYQASSDSLNKVAEGYRTNYNALPDSLKPAATRKISEAGSLADNYMKLADERLRNSDSAKAPTGDLQSVNIKQTPQGRSQNISGSDKENLRLNQQKEPVLSAFEVIKDPAKIREQKIEIDPGLPSGLIYRIQMGVFSKPVDPVVFKGISPLYGIKIQGSVMIRYFAGMFRRIDDANKALMEIKKLGFKDSFIVPTSDGVTISLERAAVMEKEWGSKSLFSSGTVTDESSPAEASPLTLSFRVELTRSDKPLKEDIEESYRKLAGNKRFEILSPVEGQYVYLIGNFITFESASEYANLLNRNGYRDAKVVAYLGNREIPVETAKQLFEKIE
jgi:tetratricopeptide (TPR) repeat protein